MQGAAVGQYLIDPVGMSPRIDCPACSLGICASKDHTGQSWLVTDSETERACGLFQTREAAIIAAYRLAQGDDVDGRV